jgi:hypothetical protein
MKKIAIHILALFLFALSAQAQTNPPAGKIMANAYRQATKENKNIFLIFHASWCTWCHKMDEAMNDKKCKAFFQSNYVVVHLTVGESDASKNTPGADAYLNRFHGDSAGLPFWVVTNNRGVWLADSYMRKEGQTKDSVGVNIGCPAEDVEVDAFCKALKVTSKMTDKQLSIIASRFKKNKESSRPVKKKE